MLSDIFFHFFLFSPNSSPYTHTQTHTHTHTAFCEYWKWNQLLKVAVITFIYLKLGTCKSIPCPLAIYA